MTEVNDDAVYIVVDCLQKNQLSYHCLWIRAQKHLQCNLKNGLHCVTIHQADSYSEHDHHLWISMNSYMIKTELMIALSLFQY